MISRPLSRTNTNHMTPCSSGYASRTLPQRPLGSWRTVTHDKNDVISCEVPLESMPLLPLQDGAQVLLRKSSPQLIGNVLNKPPASTGLTVFVSHGNGRVDRETAHCLKVFRSEWKVAVNFQSHESQRVRVEDRFSFAQEISQMILIHLSFV